MRPSESGLIRRCIGAQVRQLDVHAAVIFSSLVIIKRNFFETAETTSADAKKEDAIKNAIFSILGGGKNAVKTQALEVRTDEKLFATEYTKLLSTASDALINALR